MKKPLHLICALLGVFLLPSHAQDQFGSPTYSSVPGPFDNRQGELTNFETQLIDPLLVTTTGHVVVANEPNGTLDVLSTDLILERSFVLGHGIASISERTWTPPKGIPATSELWVTVRHQQAIAVISTDDWSLTHWVRAPIAGSLVGYGAADQPGQVAFNPSGSKAYVPSYQNDSVAVFDANSKAWLKTISLEIDHNGQDTKVNTPFSAIAVGETLYVVSQVSGNQTKATISQGPFPATPQPGSLTDPVDGFFIENLEGNPDDSLPDFDVVAINMGTDSITGHFKDVGSTSFNIHHVGGNNRLWVTNLHARNGEFIGESSWPEGKVVFNRITIIDPDAQPTGPHTHLVIEDQGSNQVDIAQPTAMASEANGRVFVCGYGSSNVGVFNRNGIFLGSIATDSGPRGIAVFGSSLYVLSRGYNRVLRYDISGSSLPTQPNGELDLVDPTPENIKSGRRHFISSENSGGTSTSCNSCHIDGRLDGLAWDLSQYLDDAEERTRTTPPHFWEDRKGIFVTQDMRSLEEVAPYHWRGEQQDLVDFNGAFSGLLHGSPLDQDAFADFEDFVFSMTYTANGEQQLNRAFSGTVDPFFDEPNVFSTSFCFQCHSAPYGTDNAISLPTFVENTHLAPLTAQLRGLNFKESDRASLNASGDQVPATGFGLLHNGRELDSDGFIQTFFDATPLEDPKFGDARRAFLNEFDTGIAPAAHYSELINQQTIFTNRMQFMIEQANLGNCDLVGRGHIELHGIIDQDIGILWDRGRQMFVFDDDAFAPQTANTILFLAASGSLEILMLGTPVWSGERIGVDLDRDGIYDGNELAMGLDPHNPDSDGDGLWDSYDPNPDQPSAPPAGPVTPFNVQVSAANTNTIKVTWETTSFSPTRLVYGVTTNYNREAGDDFPLSARSLSWKRRHTAFLRLLQADSDYHFAIVTQGQNGVIAQSADFQTASTADTLGQRPQNIHIDQMTIQASAVATGTEWTATVRVVNGTGVPQSGYRVRGMFVHFSGDDPQQQDYVGPVLTDGAGVATLTTISSGQSPGDRTQFRIPFLVDDTSFGVIVPVGLPGTEGDGRSAEFIWTDGTPRSIYGFIP